MIHPTAIISPKAEIGNGVQIGAHCIVGDARIGDGTVLDPFARVCSYVDMGANNHVHSYAVIGGEPQDHGYKGEVSFVKIGDGNIFREYVTVNRATGENCITRIGSHCLLMEGVHVGHNVEICNKVTIANKVGIAGFVVIDDFAVIGGMVGFHQFIRVGTFCMVGGMYRVTKDVPPYTLAGGEPLRLMGLNVIGLRRANFPEEKRRKIAAFYKKLYSKDKIFSENLVELKESFESADDKLAEIAKILDFYSTSKRGITFWGGKKSANEVEI